MVKGQGKGKNKWRNKGAGRQQLASEDGQVDEADESEEKQWKDFLAKAKKARDAANVAKENCEAALNKADLAKRLTKASKKDTENLWEGTGKKVKTLKEVLAKQEKEMKLEKAKDLLVEVMNKVKEVKEETKEMVQLACKASSRAFTQKSK